jgi:ATP/maltotriose-dependent transcriptional regulator MalT
LRLAQVALLVNRAADAVDQARAVCATAEASRLRPLLYEAQAVLSAALVQTDSCAEAAELAREAVVRTRTLRLPMHEAVCRRAMGSALVHTGDVAQGRRHLEAAAVAFERMGARIEQELTMRTLAGLS